MQKLTPEVVQKIYKNSWNPGYTIPEVGKKYGICEGYVIKIKQGRVYSNITGHVKSTVPEFINKQKQKPKPEMSTDQKLAVLMKDQDVALLIDDYYLNLFRERGQDIADQFKQRIYDIRGERKRKLSTNEVDGLYEEFKNHENGRKNMTIDSTKANCILDLTLSYGRYGALRLSEAINEKEQALNRKLSREEILEVYREIDEELCRIVFTRAGK